MCRHLSTEEEDSKACKKDPNYHIIDGCQDNASLQTSRLRGYYLQKVPHYCSHHVTVHTTTTSNLVQYSPTKYTLRYCSCFMVQGTKSSE